MLQQPGRPSVFVRRVRTSRRHAKRSSWPVPSVVPPIAGGRNSDVSSGASRAVLRPSRLHGEREAAADELRELPLPVHARAEARVVVAAPADLPDEAHHVRGAQRVVRIEPGAEERCDLARQAQHACSPRGVAPAAAARLEDRLEIPVGELRNHRRDIDAHRHAGLAERSDDRQPALRRRRARIELARELAVEHRDRDEHAHETLRRHRGEEVEVALDQHALGGDRQRMVAGGQHLDDAARDLPLALDRLVRIRVRAERDRVAHVARLRELGAQQLGGVGLGEELRLEIEARRQVEIRVRRPRVAVDAAVLAALVRVDRLAERNVGRIVARDDRARGLDTHDRLRRRRRNVVLRRGRSATQPSSTASRWSRMKRLCGLKVAPRPLAGAPGAATFPILLSGRDRGRVALECRFRSRVAEGEVYSMPGRPGASRRAVVRSA